MKNSFIYRNYFNFKCIFIIHFIIISLPLFAQDNYKNLIAPDGFKVELFSSNIEAPRQMAEGEDYIFVGGIKGKIFAINKKNQENVMVIASGLTNSRGVALKDRDLYFAEIDKIWVIKNINSVLRSMNKEEPKKLLFNDDLPSDAWHGGKWIKFDSDGKLYANVGAPCNICLDGMTKDERYASIIKLEDGKWKTVARGVRNSVGFDWHPQTKKLYFGDNGRDWLGDDSPSCELNVLDEEDSFFGFPFLHATDVIDPEFGDMTNEIEEEIVLPVLEIGAHVAPTGVSFYNGNQFPKKYKNTLFMALHGSWNRSKKSGYKVLAVHTDKDGNVTGTTDFLSGFLDGQKSWGRPSAPLALEDGSLLVSDDKHNAIYKITYTN
ncbi:MAG: PQQ-dependent sugar dehydrogenase [Gammaproteobacteria bacterium]